MDEKIEKLVELAGNSHRYQYIMLFISCMVWINVDMISISLAYLERMPDVYITNSERPNLVHQLNYTLCERNKTGNISLEIATHYGYSWVSEYDIYCDKLLTSSIGSFCFLGSFIGAIIFHLFANSFGRKNTASLSLLWFAVLASLIVMAPNIITVMIICLLMQLFASMTAISTFMLSLETVAVKHRGVFGSIINSGFSICGITYILLFKYLNDWRQVFVTCSALSLFFGLLFFVISKESYRFYFSKGKIEELVLVLQEIAAFNGRKSIFTEEINKSEYKVVHSQINSSYNKNTLEEASEIFATEFIPAEDRDENIEKEKDDACLLLSKQNVKEHYSVFDLLKYPSVRSNFLIMCFLWFCSGANYYGISINIKNLPGDIYVNGIIIYTLEVISYIFSGNIINVIGRKKTLYGFYLIAILGYLTLIIFTLSDLQLLIITFIARFCISGIFTIFYTYALELYPTVIRAQGFSCNSGCARIASILVPFVIELLSKDSNNLLFAVMNIGCIILLIFLPETKGHPLHDFIHEHINIYKITEKI